jgi:hypothetical protein
MSQQAVSAITPNQIQMLEYFLQKTEGTKTKAARLLIGWLPRKFKSLKILGPYCSHSATPQRLNPK